MNAKRTLLGAVATIALMLGLIGPSSALAAINIEAGGFTGVAVDENGKEFTQAGGHPYEAIADIKIENVVGSYGGAVQAIPGENMKNVVIDIPRGFIGNPGAITRCAEEAFHALNCPTDSQVGIFVTNGAGFAGDALVPIYNLEPPTNSPAAFGFLIAGRFIRILGTARTDDDFGIRTVTKSIPQANPVLYAHAVLWGTPGDSAHDPLRGVECGGFLLVYGQSGTCPGGKGGSASVSGVNAEVPGIFDALEAAFASEGLPFEGPVKPFISMGTDCDDLAPTTFLRMDSWENPAPLDSFTDPLVGHPNLVDFPVESPAVTGCHKLVFKPSVAIQVKNKEADTPTGVAIDMAIPQNETPEGLSTPHLDKAVVTLPEGMTINPAAGDGQGGCSSAQIGLTSKNPIRFTKTDANCPQSSKVATAEVETPLLPDLFTGDVYVAEPFDNPFNSLYAIYIVLRGPGLVVKVAGKIEPDPVTGRLKTTFDQNPQLTFDELRLNFFGGPRAPLATPPTCGTKTIEAELTPWSAPQSGPPALRNSVYIADQGPTNGTPCSNSLESRPFKPTLAAGTGNPIAGGFAALTMRLARPDGHQELAGLTVKPPLGFTGVLKGVPYCTDAQLAAAANNAGRAELANSTCPGASQIGKVLTGAGAGPTPLFTEGKAYLAGPYKGAPLSMAVLTPAVAGPFDLGVVVVRVALHVNPRNAQITAISDPVPQILEGIPLRIKDIRVHLDKKDFGVNPTNCEPLTFAVDATGNSGASTSLTSRFQVGGCADLPFKPRFQFKLKGGTKRGDHPAFTATVTARPGDANIGRVAATVPSSEFLDQAHIRTICTRVQFAADTCPKAAIYGSAKAITPLLDDPLEGPVYLRSSDNKLPDLVALLKGPDRQPIEVELVGRIDSIKGQIRNTFDVVPDAPVTKFTLSMQGGEKGLLVNSRNICKGTFRATVKVTGANGKKADQRPKMVADCGKGRKGKRKAR